jgi:hypothetical protein
MPKHLCRSATMPSRLTLALIDDMTSHSRGVAGFMEERIALLHRAPEAQLSGEQAEPGREQQLS